MVKILCFTLSFLILAGCSGGETTALGVAVYPGAAKTENGGVAAQMGTNGMELMTFKTKDDQAKVAEFYKGKFPKVKPLEMSFGGDAMTVFRSEDAKTKTLIVVQRKKSDTETRIEIASGKQDEK